MTTYGIGMLDFDQQSEAWSVKTPLLNYLVDTGFGNAFNQLCNLYDRMPAYRKTRYSRYSLNQLDVLVLSHGDKDHSGGVLRVVDHYQPRAIVFSPVHFDRHVLLLDIYKNAPLSLRRKINTVRHQVSNLIDSGEFQLFRVVSNQLLNTQRNELWNEYSRQYELETIIVTQPNMDIMVLANKKEFRGTRSFQEFIKVVVDKAQEFETYDDGQTREIQRFIDNMLADNQLHGDIRKLARIARRERYIPSSSQSYTRLKYKTRRLPSRGRRRGRKETLINIFWKSFRENVLKNIDNSLSLIVRIRSSLFTGDAQAAQLERLTDAWEGKRKINVIKVSHHGSPGYHVDRLYTTFRPKIAMMKTSERVDRTHSGAPRSEDTRQKIERLGIPVYCSRHVLAGSRGGTHIGYSFTVRDHVASPTLLEKTVREKRDTLHRLWRFDECFRWMFR